MNDVCVRFLIAKKLAKTGPAGLVPLPLVSCTTYPSHETSLHKLSSADIKEQQSLTVFAFILALQGFVKLDLYIVNMDRTPVNYDHVIVLSCTIDTNSQKTCLCPFLDIRKPYLQHLTSVV